MAGTIFLLCALFESINRAFVTFIKTGRVIYNGVRHHSTFNFQKKRRVLGKGLLIEGHHSRASAWHFAKTTLWIVWGNSLFVSFPLCAQGFACPPEANKHDHYDPISFKHPGCLSLGYQFDCTRGFEGEGPWTLTSVNVGSFEKHQHIMNLDADVIALQETRHTRANQRELTFKASANDKEILWGPAMKYNPSGHSEWGGVAFVTNPGTSRLLEAKEDASKHFHSCLATNRVVFAWTTINSSHSMLLVSVYGFSGAQYDPGKHVSTDNVLRQILELVAQFGNIPIAICGDLQAVPHSYSSIREAIARGYLYDPFLTHDGEAMDRPFTFCRTRDWKNDEASKSSIDAILLNQAAHNFLVKTEVDYSCGLQHALLRLSFDFPHHNRLGFCWRPHAKLDVSGLTNLQSREDIADALWENKYKQQCEQASNSEALTSLANEYCVEILLRSGATWKHGSKQRGTIPEINLGNSANLQGLTQDAPTKALNLLDKTLRRIDDMVKQMSHSSPTAHPQRIALTCWNRIKRVLQSYQFDIPEWPSFQQLFDFWDFVAEQRHKLALQLRHARIQGWKKKIQHSALTNNKDVFTYLKMRHNMPVYTPICDHNALPVYNPQEAIDLACNQWDRVFSANSDEFPCDPFFNVVGPILGNNVHQCRLQPISEADLKEASRQRKVSAAPGMDGWRTDEVHALPTQAFRPWAQLWNGIENGTFTMPSIFKCARLVMLPKPDAKNHEPISRRLISLLSVHYLAYSRARFRATIPWQLKTFPDNLTGAVPGRQASDISHKLAIKNELSISQGKGRIGIKLDRSKCFDRVVPDLVGIIAIRLGMDPGFIRAWTSLYKGFQRFISYGCFISQRGMKSSNGIAQGDCASVLAINVLMCAWTKLMRCFTKVSAYIFIDDAYIESEQRYLEEFVASIQATKLFDDLCGQALNLTKSCAWGTTQKARSLLRARFPELPLCELVQVLGGHIKANARNHVMPASSKFHLIKSLIDDIGHLPISFNSKTKIIAIKVSPMISYASEINVWPRKCIEAFTQAIIRALWKDRPHWRCAELLFALTCDPTKVFPPAVIATTTIVNIVKRCRSDADFLRMWIELNETGKVINKGLLDNFGYACSVVGLRFVPPCGLQFLGFPIASMMDFTSRSLRRLIRSAARQSLYHQAITSSRHDLCSSGSGILDPDVNPLGREWDKPWHKRVAKLDEAILLGPLLGATPTGNRLYQSGLIDQPHCRFCGFSHENIQHLTRDCKEVQKRIGQPCMPFDNQPQWESHGIYEVPMHILQAMQNDTGPTMPLNNRDDVDMVWTDGSAINASITFARTLGSAVIAANGEVLYSVGWKDCWGCSFKAELIAIQAAIRITTRRTTICTDCKSIVKSFNMMVASDNIPDTIAYKTIWEDIFQNGGKDRISLRWIKAHQVDNGHWESASRDQILNYQADQEAKRQATLQSPVSCNYRDSVVTHLYFRRHWLTKLSLLLAETKIEAKQDEQQEVDEAGIEEDGDDVKNRFPKWDWGLQPAVYHWKMSQENFLPPRSWKFSTELWQCTLRFFQRLQWRVDADASLSIYEVAFIFFRQSRCCPPEINQNTAGNFLVLPGWLRHCLREYKKMKINVAPPNCEFQPRKATFCGARFPYGRWVGGRAFLGDHELRALGSFILSLPNGGRAASDWAQSLNRVP